MDQAKMDLLVDLLLDLDRAGIRELVPEGDCLRYRPRWALTPDLHQRLRTHKADLLAVLRPAEAPGDGDLVPVVVSGSAGQSEAAEGLIQWEDCVAPSEPCPGCAGLMFWWNLLGDRRCLICDPPKTALRLLEKAEAIRRRLGIPSPAGAAKMLGEIKRWTDT